MASANPRRSTRSTVTRSGKPVDNGLSLNTTMTLRKSPTFHSPNTPSSSTSDNDDDDDFVPPSIRRSHTNLEDVIDSHYRRVALIVDDISKSLNISDTTSASPTKSRFRDDSLPLPRSFVDPPVVDPAMAKQEEPERRQLRPRNRRPSRNHASDSGLGTSVASSKEKRAATNTSKKASAITRSAAASSTAMDKVPGLSQRAVNRIMEHTLRPLLAKPSLKDFEPIVLDVPRRIRDKEIICLRDLEKTLIFMAPERTKTADLYLDFCLTSIRCIQSTVDYLSDREQTRPRDRPYTNLYFMDLEEQVRQYARQLANAKEKASQGEDDQMDLNPADEVRLYGGLSKNGRPAELVRVKKDGKAISMATGKPVNLDDEEDGKRRLKRSLSEQLEDDEEIMRSMARRKKNASPEELAPKKCREPGCNKEFKRPCDLTKHEKTHSRPWKCPVETCKYHEYGWPTEKEMGRHHNDKHSSSPATFECYYKPCPYKSKRESNCKQHMEKAHGWRYVRTKTNGKKAASSSSNTAQVTPQLTNAPTPGTNSMGVQTPPEESMAQFMPLAPSNSLDFPAYVPHDQFVDDIGHHPLQLPELDEMNIDLSPVADTPSTAPFENFPGFEDTSASSAFNLTEEELYAAPAHLPTPEQSAFKMLGQPSFQTYVGGDGCQDSMSAPHISPIGHGNAMLYTPKSLCDVDEGFDDFPSNGDFQLYPNTGKVGNYDAPLFGEIPSAGMGFSQPSQEMFAAQMDWTQNADYPNFHGQH